MNPRAVPWPNGARCAAAITFDCDADSLMHLGHPDTAYRRISGLSWLQYDRVAVPEIVSLFDSYGIRQTFFVPAWCIERYPESLKPIVDSGHEIAAHGYLHESPNKQSPEGERYWLQRSAEIIESFSGRRPVGFRAGWADYSPDTTDILASEGFLYDSTLMGDSFPYLLNAQAGQIVELPIDLTMDDWAHFAHFPDLAYLMQPSSPDRAAEVFLAEFEAAYERGSVWIPVCHPMVSGRPARLARMGQMIEYIQAKGDVWFATLEEIARHVQAVTESGEYTARTVDMPLYPPGRIPELREDVAGGLAIRLEAPQ
jgi:peptidoglycan/xylan/chitin deacetylase (PgdA/CDA1 family)